MYGEFAFVYDSLMKDFDYEAFKDYYIKILSSYEINQDKLLEIGCGTGTMTELLSDNFNEITAIDISDDMLAVAFEKLHKKRNVKLIKSDISDFSSESKYDVAVACCDVLNYITSQEILRRAFYSSYAALKDKGIFLFDLSSVWKLKNQLGNKTYIKDTENLFLSWENKYNDYKNIVDMRLNIFLRNGEYFKRIIETQEQRGYESESIIEMLYKTGFSDVFCYKPLTFEICSENIPRLQFLAIK